MEGNKENIQEEELNYLYKELEALKKQREVLASSKASISNFQKIEKVKQKEKEVKESNEVIEFLNKELEDINKEIEELENGLVQDAKDYENAYKRFQEIVSREYEAFNTDSLLSEEDINSFKEGISAEKLKVNNESVKVQSDLEKKRKQISILKRKRTAIRKDIEKAESLDLNMSEYKEISGALRKTKIVEAILAQKGLNDIIAKPSKERTKEEKQQLKDAKAEILREISEVKKKDKDISVYDAIQSLYYVKASFKSGKSRVVKMTQEEINAIKYNTTKMPVMIIDYSKTSVKVKHPEAPKDLVFLNNENYNGLTAVEVEKGKIVSSDDIEKQLESTTKKEYTADDYNIVQEAFDEIKSEGIEPGTKEFEEAVIIRGYNSENKETIKDEELDEAYEKMMSKTTEDNIEDASVGELNSEEDTDSSEEEIIDNSENNTNLSTEAVVTTAPLEVTADNTYKPRVYKIIADISKNTGIKNKDAKRYTASNISVLKTFKEELKSGKVIYNVAHVGKAIGHLGVNTFNKYVSKLLLTPTGIKAVEEVKKRLKDLDEEKLEVLFHEYRGATALQDMNVALLPLIQERMRLWITDKINLINEDIKMDYELIASFKTQLESIDKELNNKNTTEQIKQELMNNKERLYEQAAIYIKDLEKQTYDAKLLLSSGLHGLEEDYKAITSKKNYIGFRFAKMREFDEKLTVQIGEYDDNMGKALASNNNKELFDNFIKREKCFIDNTVVKTGIFGRRSVGEKYYTPFALELDYRPDELVSDIITTVAMVTATVSVVNAIRVHQIENADLLKQQKHEYRYVNRKNDEIFNELNAKTDRMVSNNEVIREGLKAQVHQNVLNTANTNERSLLDSVNWDTSNSIYASTDATNHAFTTNFYDTVTTDMNIVANRLGAGVIDSDQALLDMTNIANNAQNTFVGVVRNALDNLNAYMAGNASHDLTATKEALEYIVAHPNAITDMNNAIFENAEIAENLVGLEPVHAVALSQLPSDMVTTLIGAAGSVALANNVINSMNEKKIFKKAKVSKKAKIIEDRKLNDEISNMFTKKKEEEREMKR